MENMEQKPYLVLGLDPGIASCGFALLDLNNHKILEMGAHLFDTPQEAKTKTSLAVTRRNARSVRRNNARTKNRQKHCLKLLQDAGMVPADADKSWFQSRKGDKPILKLRARGLDMLLTDRQFAQILYSLSGHRGYIPHGEGSADGDTEGKRVLSAIDANAKQMEEGNYRTVGEMLNAGGSSRNKGGDYTYCVRNSQIVDEVHAIFTAQRALGNPLATEELEAKYIEGLRWEKKSSEHDEKVYALVGSCSYFPDQKRAATADISSELCRAYERLGHLVMVDADGNESRLTAQQRDLYISSLFSFEGGRGSKVTYSRIRKDLDLPAKTSFKGIAPEEENKREPFDPKAWRLLRKNGVPASLLERMFADRELGDAVGEALTYASNLDSLTNRLEMLEVSDEELEVLKALPYSSKIFKGYGKRSLKALNMLIDSFEDEGVLTLTDAEKASGLNGPKDSDGATRSTTLPPYEAYDPTCNNPVVLRAMGRMRRIVNAVIKRYGVPDEIHIELGRELKHSAKEKDLISKRNRQNQSNNARFAEIAAGILKIEPAEVSGKVLRKLALREEQDEKDAYTGKEIDLERLVTDDHYCEIDHILPYSRTCDDSRNNKVLVLQKSNQDKKERTPYEWMTSGESDAPSWEQFKARTLASPKLYRKRSHLLNTTLERGMDQEFLSRNLNDTRYMSVAVKNYLEDSLLFPEDGRKKHVSAVAGGATGNLRWVWGLNFGSNNEKDRTDDRHHAVDAAVIAACSDATVKKVADARSKGPNTFKQMREDRLASTQPWESFAIEVRARKNEIAPTRMVSHGVTGRAFEDTLYKFKGFTDDKKHLAILITKETTTKKGNVVVNDDGSAKLVDGMAFLRIWLDPDANPKSKYPGKWYLEPVYYADIPAIKAGTYIPRALTGGVARAAWGPVPEGAHASKPIVLFRGDVLEVDGHIGRFWTVDINTGSLNVLNLLTSERLEDFPTLSKWTKDSTVRVIQEDCLGHCYKDLVLSPDTSAYEKKDKLL